MQETRPSDDYISIKTLKDILFNFFGFVFKAFEFLITAIQRSLSIFIFCCLVGLAAGYIYYWQSSQYYATEMIVRSNDLSRKIYGAIIKNLNDLLATQSSSKFATELKIDQSIGSEVLSIETQDIDDDMPLEDTSGKIYATFNIAIKTASNQHLPIFQNALLYYLNNSPYLKQKKEGEKRIYLERLQFIEKEQNKLDSLKENYNLALVSMKMPATFYNNAFNPAEVYIHSSKLAEQREAILKWLNNESDGVVLIDGFKSTAIPQSTSWKIPLLIGLALGVVLGMLLSVLSVIKKELYKN